VEADGTNGPRETWCLPPKDREVGLFNKKADSIMREEFDSVPLESLERMKNI
jgi:hypothetical protein